MILLKTIQEYLKDKSILVICHGERDESIVEEYDIVIRISGDTKPCDIYINPFLEHHYDKFNLSITPDNFKYILKLNAERGYASLKCNQPPELERHTYYWNKKEHDKLATEWIGYLRPTTGASTIAWLVKHTQFKELTIIGMDFYNNSEKEGVHRPLKERLFIENLVKKHSNIHHL